MILFVFFILFFMNGSLSAQEEVNTIICSKNEYHILDKFFRTLITNESVGWVCTGSKPLCSKIIFLPEHFSTDMGSALEGDMVELVQGFSVLSRLTEPGETDTLVCTWHTTPGEGTDILFINKKRLQKVVRKNLPLFRYTLGATLETQDIVNELCSLNPQKNMTDILGQDMTLYGIVYGYGTQNSLLVSREITLLGHVEYFTEIPKMLPSTIYTHQTDSPNNTSKKFDPFFGPPDYARNQELLTPLQKKTPPSLNGLKKLTKKQELSEIEKKLENFCLELEPESRSLFFGYTDSEESEKIIKLYKQDLSKIKKLLNRRDLVEFFIESFFW